MLKQHLYVSKEHNNVVISKNFAGARWRELFARNLTFSSQVSMASISFDMAYKGLKITQLFKLFSYVLLPVKLYIKEKKVNSDRSRFRAKKLIANQSRVGVS